MELSVYLQKICEGLSLYCLLSFVIWTYFYIILKTKYPSKSPEWTSRVVTFIHGSVAAGVGITLCGRPSRIEEFFTKIGPFHYMLMIWSWGYFAFDLLWCLLYWPKQLTMLGHHVCTLIAISLYMNKEYSGCIFPCTMALMEVTNPLLQMRWFLRDEGLEKTNIFILVEMTYLSLFILLRGGLGTYILLRVMINPVFSIDEKLLTLVLYTISIVFLYDILGYVWYKYKKKVPGLSFPELFC